MTACRVCLHCQVPKDDLPDYIVEVAPVPAGASDRWLGAPTVYDIGIDPASPVASGHPEVDRIWIAEGTCYASFKDHVFYILQDGGILDYTTIIPSFGYTTVMQNFYRRSVPRRWHSELQGLAGCPAVGRPSVSKFTRRVLCLL